MVDLLNAWINEIATQSVNCEEPRVLTYECRGGCGRRVRTLEWDGYCRACAGVVEDEAAADAELRREERRQLSRDTAELLHKLGHHDRARVHEQEAER